MRAKFADAGEKVTEGKIDAATREHPDYVNALAEDVMQREQWVVLEEELAETEWRLRIRQTDGALLAAEARLTA